VSAAHYGTCAFCGCRVPADLVAEHLAEHGLGTKAEIAAAFAIAPVIEVEDQPEEDDQ
jgi:hypothetical protein